MELLAPAGGMEQLRAAVAFGADAVYLAADRFGMRARADNFTAEELARAVAFAHERGVKVHVTCNVLMMADDLDVLPSYFRMVQDAGADALIIGDMGAFALAREHAPRVELHVSTQASVANAEAARVWHSLGASRVVCAREMSLSDIARLRQDAPPGLQIEVFAHGAMCMAVSGRCLISSYLTGRSGNRGACSQSCRWNYTLEEELRPGEHFPIEQTDRGTLIMNAKDLNMLAYLDALAAAGVDSIKIEGRNKKAFYVATVVGAYRRVLDGEPAAEVADELLAISHRPYGTGFFFGEAEQECVHEGYTKETVHVADVLSCEPCGDAFRVTVRCRNRFSEKDPVEVLAPREPMRRLRIRNLIWLPDDGMLPEPVPCANRSCNRYAFESDAPIQPGAFLRMRTEDFEGVSASPKLRSLAGTEAGPITERDCRRHLKARNV